ncbi:MAG: hypothetical protein J1F35_01805 [Erysipelotrichales bacterium]|nr:hypothetical protein [Erysipelotrichales bacterium]
MKKIERTREEKRAIKRFKAEERQKVLNKERKPIRKEHFYLIGAIFILILLVSILIYVVFFGKRKDLIVPDLPTYETVDVGLVDFADKSATSDDLNSKKTSTLDVDYSIVSDFYKKGILLSNTQSDYLNDEFIITSGPLSDTSFISSISKDGKLKWLTKLDNKEFGKYHIYKTVTINNNYYVLSLTERDSKSSLTIVKISSEGEVLSTRVIKENVTDKIKDVITINGRIAVVTSNSKDINVYFSDSDLNENKTSISLSKNIDNTNYLNYENGSANNNTLSLVVSNGEATFKVSIDMNSYSVDAASIEELANLNTTETLRVGSYLNGYTAYTNQVLYKLDTDYRLINKFDYSSIKLEDDKALKEKYKDEELIDGADMENSIYIDTISNNTNSIIVNTKTLYSSIYDIYDENLIIQKRIILDTFKYSYEDGVILNSFYIDGSIYEIYSYGTETPSIMISKIG